MSGLLPPVKGFFILFFFTPSASGLPKDPADVRNKTFFMHVVAENDAVVSKSAVFTHVRSRNAW